MEDKNENLMSVSTIKAKVATSEMKLKTKHRNCICYMPNIEKEMVLNPPNPLSQSLSELGKTFQMPMNVRENIFFPVHDLNKMREIFNEYQNLTNLLMENLDESLKK